MGNDNYVDNSFAVRVGRVSSYRKLVSQEAG